MATLLLCAASFSFMVWYGSRTGKGRSSAAAPPNVDHQPLAAPVREAAPSPSRNRESGSISTPAPVPEAAPAPAPANNQPENAASPAGSSGSEGETDTGTVTIRPSASRGDTPETTPARTNSGGTPAAAAGEEPSGATPASPSRIGGSNPPKSARPSNEPEATPPAVPTDGDTGSSKIYRVEVGAPQTRSESERLAADLRKNGFDARVVADGSIYRVQAGVFRQRKNAERQADALGGKGFAATIAAAPGE